MIEKRREGRISGEHKVVLRLPPESAPPDGRTLVTLSADVSAGGLRVVTDAMLAVDSLVRVEIGLSRTRQVVRGTARVHWRRALFEGRAFEQGLRFVELEGDGLADLLDYVYRVSRPGAAGGDGS